MKKKEARFTIILIHFSFLLNFYFILSVKCANDSDDNEIIADIRSNGCAAIQTGVHLSQTISACRGSWSGNGLKNAEFLCASGFQVCALEDIQSSLLLKKKSNLKLKAAHGCFVMHTSENGSAPCNQCRTFPNGSISGASGVYTSKINQDGHKVDGSKNYCCFNVTIGKICSNRGQRDLSGALCCRKTEKPGHGLQRDENSPHATQMVHLTGERVTLNCPLVVPSPPQAVGQQIHWFKNGQPLSRLTLASWSIQNARPSDSGLYSCRFDSSDFDRLTSIHINLTVKEVASSACADGNSEGFHDSQNVRGCAGVWKGHIRRADKQLCGNGWRVCTPKDKPFLMNIDSVYLTDFGGCFAFNAANIKSKCKRCQNKHSLVALGRDCLVGNATSSASTISSPHHHHHQAVKWRQRHRLSPSSSSPCSASNGNRVVSIYSEKFLQQNAGGGCLHRSDNSVTGVLCCRKWQQKKHRRLLQMDPPATDKGSGANDESAPNVCYPECRNGGTCTEGRCLCQKGYFGHACQHGGCSPRCLNGGLCLYGFCKCYPPFHGLICQHNNLPIEPISSSANISSTLENHLTEIDDSGL